MRASTEQELYWFTTDRAEVAEGTIDLNKVTETIIGAAIAVHGALSSNLLESTYADSRGAVLPYLRLSVLLTACG
jgi:hypothetical protein